MINRDEIHTLIDNMGDSDALTIACIISHMAGVSAEKWTGQITFKLNASQGSFGETHINKGEVFRPSKKRRVRSTL